METSSTNMCHFAFVLPGIYRTNNLKSIVLDEADTLLDDSFNKRVVRILGKLKVNGKRKEN